MIKIICALFLFLNNPGLLCAAEDLFSEAKIFYNQAKFEAAAQIYKELIKRNPADIEIYLNLAYLYKGQAQYNQAIEVLQQAAGFFRDVRIEMLLGRLHYLNGNPEAGLSYLEKLLPYSNAGLEQDSKPALELLFPDDPVLLLYLGLCYEDLGRLDDAQNYYLKTREFTPFTALASSRIGHLYQQKKQYALAAEAYQQLLAFDASIVAVRRQAAEALEKAGNLEQAFQQYARCLAISPQDELIRQSLEKVKAELGEDFEKSRRELVLQRQKRKLARVRPSKFAALSPQVRVGISQAGQAIKFKCASAFKIIDKESQNTLFKGSRDELYALALERHEGRPAEKKTSDVLSIRLEDSQGNILLDRLKQPFLITTAENAVICLFDILIGEGDYWAGWSDQQYRGVIEVIPARDGFRLVNLLNLEEYLYGVLPAEMPSDWPKEALRTQAIAARTWAIKNLNRHRQEGFNLCNTVHCQAYRGASAETPRTNQAVDDTAGLIIALNEEPAEVFYSSNCGGITRNGVADNDSLGVQFPFSPLALEEWLIRQPEAFCNLEGGRSAGFRWMRFYKRSDLQSLLAQSGIELGELRAIIPWQREASGHLASLKLQGDKKERLIEGENNIRRMLGNLRSSRFIVELKYDSENQPEEFIFYGGGFGHARGICQVGVKGMSLKGHDHRQIIEHYYPGAQIKKIY